MIVWNAGIRNMTALIDFLDEPAADTDRLIRTFEATAGVTGEWDWDDECGASWWGLHGTFHGELFTVYTHKSGRLKIGGDPDGALDRAGLKAALLALLPAKAAA